VCCSVLQCVAVCCSALQCVAVCCSLVTQGRCSTSTDMGELCCNALQHPAMPCNSLQHIHKPEIQNHWHGRATLQYTATHCNSLQHTSTHCSTRQHYIPKTSHQTMIPMPAKKRPSGHFAIPCHTPQHYVPKTSKKMNPKSAKSDLLHKLDRLILNSDFPYQLTCLWRWYASGRFSWDLRIDSRTVPVELETNNRAILGQRALSLIRQCNDSKQPETSTNKTRRMDLKPAGEDVRTHTATRCTAHCNTLQCTPQRTLQNAAMHT